MGVVIVALSTITGNVATGVLGVLGVVLGTAIYVSISRYEDRIAQFWTTSIDFTTKSAFVGSLVQLLAFAVLFAGLLFLTDYSGFVASSVVDRVSSAPLLAFLGILPGVVLGAGYPVIIQRQTRVPLLTITQHAFGLDAIVTIGAYVVLLVGYDPVSAVFYSIAFVLCRLTSLSIIYGRV